MRCQVCGKEIGIFRRLWDQQYCSSRHRKTARRLSARALRDAQDFDDLEEPWLITPGLSDEKRKSGPGISPAGGILLLVLVIFVVLVAPPGGNSPPPPRPTARRSFKIPPQIRQLIPGAPSVDHTEDFRTGLDDWIGSLDSTNGWEHDAGKIRLGRLRLWKPTMSMADYQMIFQGQIETKAMGWAFRASSVDNYYATKIAIPGPGGPLRPEIVHYVVEAGQKTDLVQLPLPVSIEARIPYRIRVQVRDNRFATMVNGQVVDIWSDARHSSGGVGFFSDPGEEALVSWVRVNNAEGFFSRFFSFSILMGPADLMSGAPFVIPRP